MKRVVLGLFVGFVSFGSLGWAQGVAATSKEVSNVVAHCGACGGGKLRYREVRGALPRAMPVEDRGYISEVASRTLPILLVQAAAAFPRGLDYWNILGLRGR